MKKNFYTKSIETIKNAFMLRKKSHATRNENIKIHNNIQSMDFKIDNVAEDIALNPYKYKRGSIATLIKQIANDVSNMDYQICDLNGDPVDNVNRFGDLIKVLNNPSLRQPSFRELIKDMTNEYSLLNLQTLQYNYDTKSLSCIKSFELTAERFARQNEYFNTGAGIFRYRKIKNNPYDIQEDFEYNQQTKLYESLQTNTVILPSEMVFENENLRQFSAKPLYSFSPLLDLPHIVGLYNVILMKNYNLVYNKIDGNIILVCPDGDIPFGEIKQEAIREVLEASKKQCNNGEAQYLIQDTKMKVESLDLNNNNFEAQHEAMLNFCEKKLYNHWSVPIEKGLEQATYNNKEFYEMSYVENAILSSASYIYNHLTTFLRNINLLDQNHRLQPAFKQTLIYKLQQIKKAQMLKELNVMTVDEIRAEIDLEPLPDSQQGSIIAGLVRQNVDMLDEEL